MFEPQLDFVGRNVQGERVRGGHRVSWLVLCATISIVEMSGQRSTDPESES